GRGSGGVSWRYRLEEAARGFEPGAGGDVLPAEERAHEVLRGDGLDLLAKAVEGVAVDAGKDAAIAELFVARARRELAAHDGALAFELGEDRVGGSGWHGRALGKLGDCDRPGDLHVATKEGEARVVFVDL